MAARDWQKTLFLCSYKGASFWVEDDGENGGRRFVKHQFPMRDEPYLEDLGEDLREYEITAYVVGNDADRQANVLMSACTSRGAGILVLPMQGPVLVRAEKIKRNHKKDKQGYVAFTLNLTREGYASALASVSSLANLIFTSVERLSVETATSFAQTFTPGGTPANPGVDFVIDAGVNGIQDGVSVLEAIRADSALTPIVDGEQRIQLQTIFDGAPVSTEADPYGTALSLYLSALAIGWAMNATTALRSFEAVLPAMQGERTGTPYPTKNLRDAAYNEAAARRVTRLAALGAYAEAIGRTPLPDRQFGISLRANVQEYFEAEIIEMPASEIALLRAVEELGDTVVNYLSRSILNLAPVVMVSTNVTICSLNAAWRLYQDPERADEIVARNRVAHPSFLPTTSSSRQFLPQRFCSPKQGRD